MILFIEENFKLFERHNPRIFDQMKTEICRVIAFYADDHSDYTKPVVQ